jgi:hypothetical protein
MTSAHKKGFSAFLRPSSIAEEPAPEPPPNMVTGLSLPLRSASDPTPEGARIRHVSSTGRVRTHSANRMLPGVTLRLTEERWERMKLLSIQERRPIQEILGEAVEAYMRGRGLPW